MPLKIYPLPEAITDQPWAIREGPPFVELQARLMSVPLAPEVWARFQRIHEQAHVKWTPARCMPDLATTSGIRWQTVQAVEDCRIHALLARAGVDLDSGGLSPAARQSLCQRVVANGDFPDAVLCAVASFGTGDFPELAAALGRSSFAEASLIAAEARQRLVSAGLDDFGSVVKVGRWLEGLFGKSDSPPRESRPGAGSGSGSGSGGEKEPLSSSLYGRADAAAARAPGAAASTGAGGTGNATSGRIIPWGTMTVRHPQRPLPVPTFAVTFKASDQGCHLRMPHRLLLDQRVFGIRRRQNGGTVLIDYSGSMNLSDANVEGILAAAPASVVAVYSGDHNTGVLKVLARDGRRVARADVSRPAGGSNVIDGPALDWLAGQPTPRYWLSDGRVTGVGDTAGEGNAEYAMKVCREARINRVPTTADLIQILRTAGRPASGAFRPASW